MSRLPRRTLLGAAALLLRVAPPTTAAQATPLPASEDVQGGVPVSVLIQNSGVAPDRLLGATSAIAEEIALHATRLDHGQRVMHEVSDIVIPAESVISLEPGAMHLMLTGLRQSLVQGQVFPLTLQFATAGDVPVEVRVRRKQDASGVLETPPVAAGSLTILHASAPPAPVVHG
ncbi:MAG: copper chaperone PCu(A)C [Chloroflexota bacterium]|nr:copper chaperone PCu(A)C [Chloroflexota bacterium]